MGSNLVFPGILLIVLGLAILVYGVRIARIYAILSALSISIGIGIALALLFAAVFHMAGSALIPILIALALAGLLLYWVGKAYIAYLKVYAILGMIKIGASIVALCLVLLQVPEGVAAIVILVSIAAVIWLIVNGIRKWSHLLFMIGIITDGALIAIAGGVMVGGGSGRVGATVLLAIITIPLLIWAGLYRECWRQKIVFPGIKSW